MADLIMLIYSPLLTYWSTNGEFLVASSYMVSKITGVKTGQMLKRILKLVLTYIFSTRDKGCFFSI